MTATMARHPAAFGVADWPERPPDRHPETLAWIDRIEAVRRLNPRPTTRRCLGPCGRMLPRIPEFLLKNSGMRSYWCRECDAARKRKARQQEKVTAYRAIPWRSA
jgi:hypothetical protein